MSKSIFVFETNHAELWAYATRETAEAARLEKDDPVVEYVPAEDARWRTLSERPTVGDEVEVMRDRSRRVYGKVERLGEDIAVWACEGTQFLTFGEWFRWRPARPIGAIPEAKEKA